MIVVFETPSLRVDRKVMVMVSAVEETVKRLTLSNRAAPCRVRLEPEVPSQVAVSASPTRSGWLEVH
ncbi:MAG: hypothetical protein ACJA1W_003520 [Akkermansiaceae bacterium]|jgi:hypothetical protein